MSKGNLVNILGGEFKPPKTPTTLPSDPPEVQLKDAISNAGFEPPTHVNFDGKIHRFGKKKSCWYIAYSGEICAGAFGDWKDGYSHNWRQNIGRELSTVEQMAHTARINEIKKESARVRKLQADTAKETAATIWENASEASDKHPYLQAKQVKSHGLKVSGDGRLIVPVIDESGEISSLQFIDSNGVKKYQASGEIEGGMFVIHGSGDMYYLAEGYATAATIHETTGCTCYVGFTAGQLPAVAQRIKDKPLTIIADNDESGTGQKFATRAAEITGARVLVPPIEGMDANDYWQAGNDLAALLSPPESSDWLIPADDFCGEPAPIRWLIKHHLQRDALIMVHGPSGGGKTFAVLDMCLHIASSKTEWCDNKVHGGSVVYLAGEGHHGLKGRIAAWKLFNRIKKLDMFLSKSGTDLNTPDGYQKTREAISSLPEKPVLIVIDTLHRFLLGDENSAQDAKTMLDACGNLQREFGASVLLVHHTGVNDEAQHRARGSSAWRGALDIEISVVPGSEEKPIELIQRKSKDAEISPPMYMRLMSVELPWKDEDGEAVSSAVISQDESYQPDVKESESVTKSRKSFQEAFVEMGDIQDGKPYLTTSAWRDFFSKSHHGPTPDATKKAFQRGRKALIDAGIVSEKGAGFIVNDPSFAGALSVLIIGKGTL
jgi:putative DNA primase/helicase